MRLPHFLSIYLSIYQGFQCSLHLILCPPWRLLQCLGFHFFHFDYPSVIRSTNINCPSPLLIPHRHQNILNLCLNLNLWCSLPSSQCYPKPRAWVYLSWWFLFPPFREQEQGRRGVAWQCVLISELCRRRVSPEKPWDAPLKPVVGRCAGHSESLMTITSRSFSSFTSLGDKN